jgi:hypothetical protein
MAGETSTIVLVHGAWADATGFDPEIRALRDRGFTAIGFALPTVPSRRMSCLRTSRRPDTPVDTPRHQRRLCRAPDCADLDALSAAQQMILTRDIGTIPSSWHDARLRLDPIARIGRSLASTRPHDRNSSERLGTHDVSVRSRPGVAWRAVGESMPISR